MHPHIVLLYIWDVHLKLNKVIKIGVIKNIFRRKKLILFSYVSDNSSLKSQFFSLFKTNDGIEMIKAGKGYDVNTNTYPRFFITKWSIRSYFLGLSFIWIGIGHFCDGNDM